MNATVCDGGTVIISCGATNVPVGSTPSWRVIRRYSNGSVMSDMTIPGEDFKDNNNVVNSMEWIPDNNTENSRLLVGPVDETYNQSSYQCTYLGVILSDTGTLTIAGKIFYYVCMYLCVLFNKLIT